MTQRKDSSSVKEIQSELTTMWKVFSMTRNFKGSDIEEPAECFK